MSTRVISRSQESTQLPRISWSDSGSATGIVQPFLPSPPPDILNDNFETTPATEDHSAAIVKTSVEQQELLEIAKQVSYGLGLADGERIGLEKAESEMKPVLNRMNQSIAEFATLRRRICKEAEQDLVRLSVAIAKKILHRELSVDPQALAGVVKAALETIESREIKKIRLHPKEIEAIRSGLVSAGLGPEVEIIADGSLERGAILLDTVKGELDCSVHTQLLEIERGFVDRLEGK